VPLLDARAVTLDFVGRINAGDVDGIVALLTEDHEFVDTEGVSNHGRETLRGGWHGYFALFPDYQILVDEILVADSLVTLVGRSTGTLSPHGREVLRRADGSLPPDDELQGPAIWTARIENGLVAQWRVYVDTTETRAALGIAR
jgi:ketosteroid isomerase-like protein